MSWPSWLTYSGRCTHKSGHPVSCRSSAGQGKFAGQINVLPLCHATSNKLRKLLDVKGLRWCLCQASKPIFNLCYL